MSNEFPKIADLASQFGMKKFLEYFENEAKRCSDIFKKFEDFHCSNLSESDDIVEIMRCWLLMDDVCLIFREIERALLDEIFTSFQNIPRIKTLLSHLFSLYRDQAGKIRYENFYGGFAEVYTVYMALKEVGMDRISLFPKLGDKEADLLIKSEFGDIYFEVYFPQSLPSHQNSVGVRDDIEDITLNVKQSLDKVVEKSRQIIENLPEDSLSVLFIYFKSNEHEMASLFLFAVLGMPSITLIIDNETKKIVGKQLNFVVSNYEYKGRRDIFIPYTLSNRDIFDAIVIMEQDMIFRPDPRLIFNPIIILNQTGERSSVIERLGELLKEMLSQAPAVSTPTVYRLMTYSP